MYKGYNVLLASGSPRRRELLGLLDIDYSPVVIKDVDETYPADLEVDKVPEYLSRLKAEAYTKNLKDEDIVITADTCVVIDGKILGKPDGRDGARAMLKELSGKTHRVVTGVTITSIDHSVSFSETTLVEFMQLTDEEIDFYVDKYKPMDKAGAYGIQEWIGLMGVRRIDGCFYNVMGLPTAALYSRLGEFIEELKRKK